MSRKDFPENIAQHTYLLVYFDETDTMVTAGWVTWRQAMADFETECLTREMNLERHKSSGKKSAYERRSAAPVDKKNSGLRPMDLCLMGAIDTIGQCNHLPAQVERKGKEGGKRNILSVFL